MSKYKKYTHGISQKQLIARRFFKHKLAVISLWVLIIFYLLVLIPEFLSPYSPTERFEKYYYSRPTRIHFISDEGFSFRPFIYGREIELDPQTWERVFAEKKSEKHPLKFFVRGTEYKFLGLIDSNLHLFGTGDANNPVFLFGSDRLGRDIFSRTIYGARISLTIGLIGVILSLVIGIIIGGISGLLGGMVDNGIQRLIEVIISIPTIPLWMALTAALPPHWPIMYVYFGITVLLSLVGWTGIARVVRGKFLSLRNEDFVLASVTFGSSNSWIIRKHLIPSFASYLIVQATLMVPAMIIGETTLTFLGLGLRAPAVSWGVLLYDVQSIKSLAMNPWLMIPGICVVVVVLAFNFVGDGLRDAVDPYTNK